MRQISQALDFTERNALRPRLNLLLDLLDCVYFSTLLLRGSKDSAETSVSDGSCDFVAVHVVKNARLGCCYWNVEAIQSTTSKGSSFVYMNIARYVGTLRVGYFSKIDDSFFINTPVHIIERPQPIDSIISAATMGASHSTPFASSSSATTASCEANDGGGPSYEPDSKIPSGSASSVPPAPMPVLARPETFEEKLYRKVSSICVGWCGNI